MSEAAVPSEHLVDIFDTNNDSEAMVVKGLLESNGIEVLVTSVQEQPYLLPVTFQVLESEAEEARQVIEEYRSKAVSEETAD